MVTSLREVAARSIAVAENHPRHRFRQGEMSAVYSRLHVHLVWATKERRRVLDLPRARRVHGLLDRLCRDRDCLALAIGGVDDHVHLLVGLRPALAVSDLVRELKVATSPFTARRLGVDGFAWQAG
ncbi:MAG: IS200/IS605 family transposase [Deltaproteobacteria bacterium]|nr:IS200/IS605 family transposase [Deltaproteobacteria bacterium]